MTRSSGSEGSIITPVLLIVLGCLLVYTLAQQYFAINRLDRTDKIACQFLTADANARFKQATNAGKTAAAQHTFIARTSRLRGLFAASAVKHHTQSASRPLLAYLDAQKDLASTSREQSLKNIALTRVLAGKGRALAAQLHC